MPKQALPSLAGEDLRGRTVLVRVDFNVPLTGGGVGDDRRIRRTLPTLRRLREAGARGVLLSHLGRPGGSPDPSLSLRPVAERLGDLLEGGVRFVAEVRGAAFGEAASELSDGEFLLLENTRFEPGEEENDPELAAEWAALGSFFVNDAFGTAHRAHASTHALPRRIRADGGLAVAGMLVEQELHYLEDALREPERPFVAALGGAKISGKIDVIRSLLPRVDRLLVGGAMANTFFRGLGLETGASLVEEDRVETARSLLEEGGERILLPVDCVVADRIDDSADTRTAGRDEVEPGERIGDVGPGTRTIFAEEISRARTIVWNGPMGVFESAPFREGTMALARAAADVADRGATVVIGGGDSAAAVEEAGVADRITHVSTGGGASLEFLAGNPLPGIEALSEEEER